MKNIILLLLLPLLSFGQIQSKEDTAALKGDGLRAIYYALDAKPTTSVKFNWGNNAPEVPVIGKDKFGVFLTGFIMVSRTAEYTFKLKSDDGAILKIDGNTVVADFTDHALREKSGKITLQKGVKYQFCLEYYDRCCSASLELRFSGKGTSERIIGKPYLYSN